MSADLRQLFLALQGKLEAALTAAREVGHPGAKGAATELDWLGMLTSFLPARYKAASAFVLDADGHLSEQVDVVIYDRQYSPLLFEHTGVIYVPAESVYAVLEVKQELAKGTIEYAAAKAASVRRLRRTSVPVPHAGGVFAPREPFRILAGVVGLQSSWTPPFGNPFRALLQALGTDERLDVGCALKNGGFDVSWDERGEAAVEVGSPETALVFFFLRLLSKLQQLGTVPAIDLREYGRGVQ